MTITLDIYSSFNNNTIFVLIALVLAVASIGLSARRGEPLNCFLSYSFFHSHVRSQPGNALNSSCISNAHFFNCGQLQAKDDCQETPEPPAFDLIIVV